MKKFLFAITISLALAACGDDSSSNADDNSSTVIDTAIKSDSSSVDKDTSSVESDTSSSVADSSVTSSSSKVKETSSATKAKEKSSSSKAKDSSTNKDSSSTKSSSSAPKDTSPVKKDSSFTEKNNLSAISDSYFAHKDTSTTGSGSLSVDETQHTITLTPDSIVQKQCVVESDGSPVWKDVDLTKKGFSAQYEFRGDTLLLRIPEESDSTAGLFVGGTSGEIYGTWTYPLCTYMLKTSEVKCDDERSQYTTITYNFSPEKYNATQTLNYNVFIALYKIGTEDYRNSLFMASVYHALYTGFVDSSPHTLFRDLGAEEIQSEIKGNHVTIVNNSNASQTFSINEKTYTISLNKADYVYNYLYYNSAEYNISLTITDGNAICQLDALRMAVNHDLCKNEYKESFSLNDKNDSKGNEYTKAEMFEKSNIDEFTECIKSIAVQQEPSPF
ncbi:MAG: hypothetical protein J6T62_05465 [Fibrobacter sp.]|nr:hypothetical protein [Fibrobacter sp.]